MKTYAQFMVEVSQPKSEVENDFIDKHGFEFTDHPASEESQHTSDMKKAKRKADYEEGGDEEIYESVKSGSVKLDDGSKVMLSDKEADMVNSLLNGLSSNGKSKMEADMNKNKKGFMEVLNFAKETL